MASADKTEVTHLTGMESWRLILSSHRGNQTSLEQKEGKHQNGDTLSLPSSTGRLKAYNWKGHQEGNVPNNWYHRREEPHEIGFFNVWPPRQSMVQAACRQGTETLCLASFLFCSYILASPPRTEQGLMWVFNK